MARLPENLNTAFMGDTKGGAFDIEQSTALEMLDEPNPDGRLNKGVVRPWVNSLDIGGRPRSMWIVDFPPGTSEREAALYEAPFEYVSRHVRPARDASRTTIEEWWLHERPRPEMRRQLATLSRFIATPTVSKHRLFVWISGNTLPDHQLIVIAREDDFTFGVLQSRAHDVWARRTGTQLRERESGFRYTPTTTFEKFGFPRPNDDQRTTIEEAAKHLVELREGWLKARPDRTLTGLYNEDPTWLHHAHTELDRAVLDAYGWPHDIDEQELLVRLLALNAARVYEGVLTVPASE